MVSGYADADGFHGRITSYAGRFDWFDCDCQHKRSLHYWNKRKGIIHCEGSIGMFRTCKCETHYCEGRKNEKD